MCRFRPTSTPILTTPWSFPMNTLDTRGNLRLVADRDRADLFCGSALRRIWRSAPGGAIVVTDSEDPYASQAKRRVFRGQALGEVTTGWNGHVARLSSADDVRGGGAAYHEPVGARFFDEDTVVLVLRGVLSFRTTDSAWWLHGWDLWPAEVPSLADPAAWSTRLPHPVEVRDGLVRWSDERWRVGLTDEPVDRG